MSCSRMVSALLSALADIIIEANNTVASYLVDVWLPSGLYLALVSSYIYDRHDNEKNTHKDCRPSVQADRYLCKNPTIWAYS